MKQSFAVEGKTTNIIIWTGKDANGKHPEELHDTVFIRLDKFQNYNAPLSANSLGYIYNKKSPVHMLLPYGFKSPIDKLPEILNILNKLEKRELLMW